MLHGYLSRVYADLVSPPLSADVTVVAGGGGGVTLSGNNPWCRVTGAHRSTRAAVVRIIIMIYFIEGALYIK